MRPEVKIGILLLAANLLLAHLITLPQFVSGLLIGLSLFFLMIGILPEKSYLKLKTVQAEKFLLIRKMVGIN